VAKPYREVPPALEGNDPRVAAIGAAAWAVALIVVFALRNDLPPHSQWWIWTCVTGVGLGLFGVVYIPILQRSRVRAAEGRRTSSPDDG
jgi:H+/Cl- antiporter ClcA